jgi:UDP-N-acetylmuramoyl-L-alanyl-D-glutamate--2,6-diaminopimelate ligase
VVKSLTHILSGVKVLKISGSTDVSINKITFDSRNVEQGDLFVAVKGTRVDGHQFIDTALERKASVIVCEEWPSVLNNNVTYIQVENSAKALGLMASAFYDHPSRDMKVIGITGTNGKTTTVFLLYQLYRMLGYKAGLLSTIENRIGDTVIKSTHTTADAVQINQNLAAMADAGCDYCFMEISSHAIEQERTAGLKIHGAIFSNITHDHLDYHGTFDKYIKAKKKLFDELPEEAFALVNTDDKHAGVMLQNSLAKKSSYSLKNVSDFKGKILENLFEGLHLRINRTDVWTRLVGSFNAYNIMAVYATACLDGQKPEEVLINISRLEPVEGRFEVVPSKAEITAVVDYAHTPDALQNVLATITNVRSGSEHLLTIVGAGGNRDKEKRPKLAQVACQYSDRVILTSDNPRDEDPEEIIKDMDAGLDSDGRRKTVKITDRREAIKTACMISVKGDIILVAGKGHETYQEVKGVRHHFDDREVLRECLNNL